MHEVLVNRLGGLSLPRKSVVRITDRPDMTLDVYRLAHMIARKPLEDIRTSKSKETTEVPPWNNHCVIHYFEMGRGRGEGVISYTHRDCLVLVKDHFSSKNQNSEHIFADSSQR